VVELGDRGAAGSTTYALGKLSRSSMTAGPRFLIAIFAVTVSPTFPRTIVCIAARSGS
jgi:hypothetical protein